MFSRAAAMAVLLTLVGAQAAALPRVTGCKMTAEAAQRWVPLEPGPAELAAVTCWTGRQASRPQTVALSPDGSRFLAFDPADGLAIRTLEGDGPTVAEPFKPTFGVFDYSMTAAYGWSSDSRFVWAVDQEVTRPGGFAAGPLRAVRVGLDGVVQPLPTLSVGANELDGLLWVGGEGLAVARFGSRGDYYRPQRPSPDPQLAFVDVARGLVLQSTPLRPLLPESRRAGVDGVGILSATATFTRDHRMRVLLRLGPNDWVLWTQGEAPRPLQIPGSGPDTRSGVLLANGGDQLLVLPGLSPRGMICEHNPNCPAPTPVTGVLATLIDTGSGKTLWALSATASVFANSVSGAISPDGRYAILGVPAGSDHWPLGGLIDLRTGRLLQTFRGPWNSQGLAGFTADSRGFWVVGGTVVTTYRLRP